MYFNNANFFFENIDKVFNTTTTYMIDAISVDVQRTLTQKIKQNVKY